MQHLICWIGLLFRGCDNVGLVVLVFEVAKEKRVLVVVHPNKRFLLFKHKSSHLITNNLSLGSPTF